MAQLTTQQITAAGLVPTLAAASAGGDTWTPTSTTFLIVNNGSGASITATVAVTATSYGQAVDNVAVAVAAGAQALIGPFPPGEVANSTGVGSVTYSASSNVSVAAVSL